MSPETQALQQFFQAVNRNDIEAITKDFHPDIVRIEPEGFPTAGTYRGIAEVQEHVRKGRGTWAEGTCDPEKFLANGDHVVVYLHVRVRLAAQPIGLMADLPTDSCFARARSSNISPSANERKRSSGRGSKTRKRLRICH